MFLVVDDIGVRLLASDDNCMITASSTVDLVSLPGANGQGCNNHFMVVFLIILSTSTQQILLQRIFVVRGFGRQM
jgi:hypothetical protein